jgi:hypothetical protein
VSGLMTHVHHDLVSVFQVVHIALQLCQVRVGQVERNADDGLPRGASPFIGEITTGAELVDAFGFQFAIELLNESFDGRTLELEPQFANGLGEYLLEFRSGFLEIAHWAIQSSIPRDQVWHGKAYRLCTYYCEHACFWGISAWAALWLFLRSTVMR